MKFIRHQEELLDKCLEKRKLTRFDFFGDDELGVGVDLETKELDKIFTRAKNLSAGGMCVELNKDIKMPSVLQLGLRLPDSQEVNQILARIIWTKGKNTDLRHYGLSFMMLTDYEEKKIRKFLDDNF